MKKSQLDIVIASSAEAKIYRYDSKQKNLELISGISHPKSRLKTSEIMSDDAGRYQKSALPNQGIYQAHTDPKIVEERKFAMELAEKLESISRQENNKIFIFAPGHFQNLLKNKLHKTTLNKVEACFDKNYIQLTIRDLEKHLSELVALNFK